MIGNTARRAAPRIGRLAPALLGLALLGVAGSAAAQAPAGDAPAVVKDFEAGQKKAKAEAPAKKKAEPAAEAPRKKTVQLSFTTVPRVSARVYYGRKLLGTTPFSVDWPRDSGPVDVVVRAHGYLPVNTRAYTFRDDDVSVQLTRPADASRLLGYKAPVEPEPEEGEEGEAAEDGDVAGEGDAAPAAPGQKSKGPAAPAPGMKPGMKSKAPAAPAPGMKTKAP